MFRLQSDCLVYVAFDRVNRTHDTERRDGERNNTVYICAARSIYCGNKLSIVVVVVVTYRASYSGLRPIYTCHILPYGATGAYLAVLLCLDNTLCVSNHTSPLTSTPRVTSNTPRCTLPVFLNVNIRGGFSQKLDELSVVLQQNNVDVACITETWLNPSIPSNLTTVDGYTTYRANRTDGRQGRQEVTYSLSIDTHQDR